MAYIVDSYSESNQSTNKYNDLGNFSYGQAFTGDGGVLNSVKVYLSKWGDEPTGTVSVKIFAETHATAFGTDSLPTGGYLAIADTTYDISTFTYSDELKEFIFTGSNKIILEKGVNYVVVVEYNNGDYSNGINVGVDSTSPTHNGNAVGYWGSWVVQNTVDTCFYVYADDAGTDTNSERDAETTGGQHYQKGYSETLPTDDSNLTTYTSQEVSDVSADDGTRVAQAGTASGYLIHQVKKVHTNSTDPINISWNGQATKAPSSATVYLQIYNRTTEEWETLDSESSASADTDFDLTGNIE